MSPVITSILTIGGVAGFGYLIFSLFSGNGGKALKGLTDLFKKKKKDIEVAEDKQKELINKVVENKKIAEEKRKEVVKIREDANKKIVEVLDKEDLESILLEEDKLWES